jgi:hypothetical protein
MSEAMMTQDQYQTIQLQMPPTPEETIAAALAPIAHRIAWARWQVDTLDTAVASELALAHQEISELMTALRT